MEISLLYAHFSCEALSHYKNYNFYVTDGQSLNPAPSEEYDFIFSTIVLQHIPVYNIRRSISKAVPSGSNAIGVLNCGNNLTQL